jgi:transcriptional regulator with XRE-family HTH domain
MLGEKLKELRESRGLLQRQVGAVLEVDAAYVSKIENNDKPLNRGHISLLSELYQVEESELVSYWLAEKILGIVSEEYEALKAIELAESELKNGGKAK